MARILSFVAILILSTIASCSSSKSIKTINAKLATVTENYCQPVILYTTDGAIWNEENPADLSVLQMSAHDHQICKLLGVTNDLLKLHNTKADTSFQDIQQRRWLQQKILNKVMLAQSHILSVTAEVDCEADRAEIAAKFLDGINERRNTKLTIASAITGALTTVATSLIRNERSEDMVGISGGFVSAGLGSMTLLKQKRKADFKHERNLLSGIWYGHKHNTEYPAIVWLLLHEKELGRKEYENLALSTKSRWLQFDLDGNVTKEDEALLFGKGGAYSADNLHSRSDMMNQLKSTVRSLHVDLDGLIERVNSML